MSSPVISDTEDLFAGILMLADKHEQYLRTSPNRLKDSVLETYLQDLTCKLAGNRCSDIRVYLLRSPSFNAFMMPNGAMFVYSGLLLRMSTTSELAFVIGHELAHYFESHGLNQAVNVKRTQQIANVLTLGQSFNTTVLISGIAQGYLSAYSRSDESEADAVGAKLLVSAGYDPNAASSVWINFLPEYATLGAQKYSFFATHPMPEARVDNLKAIGETFDEEITTPDINESRLPSLVEDDRVNFLTDELRNTKTEQFLTILDSQKKFAKLDDGLYGYLCAKSWEHSIKNKNINKEGMDVAAKKANSCYEQGDSSKNGMPSSAYKSWGRLNEKLGRPCAAIPKYQKYIQMDPNARDVNFVSRRLKKLDCVEP